MSLEEQRSRYIDLLLQLAERSAEPDLLDRIERALGGDKPADARVKGSTTQERINRFVCPLCGGKKSFYADHCIKCNAGTVGNRGGKGGDTVSEEARQAQRPRVEPVEPAGPTAWEQAEERRRENEEIAASVDAPLRVPIGAPVTVDPRSLPPWRRQELAQALKDRAPHQKIVSIAQP